MRIDVIVNTTARRYAAAPQLVRALKTASETRGEKAVFHATKNLDELAAACNSAAQRGSDLVVLSGGDGSLMAGTTALHGAFGAHLPKIGFLPAGTAAIISKNWGIVGDPVLLLSRILSLGNTLSVDQHPTLRIRAETARGAEERIGFIFGTGLVAKFFELYYEDGARGNVGAAALVARIFIESFVGGPFAERVLDPMPCTLSADGKPLSAQAFSLICSSVVYNLGLHMIVNYRAGEDFGRPHLVANALPTKKLGRRMPLVLAGKPIGGEGGFDDLVGQFVVEFPVGKNGVAEGPYVLDGDLLRASKVEVSAGPVLRVVKP